MSGADRGWGLEGVRGAGQAPGKRQALKLRGGWWGGVWWEVSLGRALAAGEEGGLKRSVAAEQWGSSQAGPQDSVGA